MDIKKINLSVPRYTSYPTVPFWKNKHFSQAGFFQTIQNAYWENSKEVSIYLHLPFCESLCTYCACNTHITKNHQVEEVYLSYLLKEWDLYLAQFPDKPIIKEIHLGGGTPTFFSPQNLEKLLTAIIETGVAANDPHFSFEGHPTNTTADHLQMLYDLGFDRVSFGIQDFDLNVQRLINRMQSYEQVKYVTETARKIGYRSVNYDMVYGLPGQTSQSISKTLKKIQSLKPDRIAYYSYAHVPKMKPAQRVFESSLPSPEDKFAMASQGQEYLRSIGYEEVGMDHYCLPGDSLLAAQKEGTLHRNFMGYTPDNGRLLIGLGASAIGDTWAGFAQNEKTIKSYYNRLDQGQLPILRGHLHTQEDLFIRKHILNLMCNFTTKWMPEELLLFGIHFDHSQLFELQDQGYISYSDSGMKINESGKKILRLICSTLDRDFNQSTKAHTFSKAV